MDKRVFEYLDRLYPDAKCEIDYNKDYELLIATLLSAQTTDKRVNKVTKILFDKYKSIYELSKASINDIENIIREIGTYHKKAVYIIEVCRKLYNDGYDYIPNDRKYIESLPGVGHKTANVFLANIYNIPTLAVDTHVARVSKRLGIAKDKDDVKVIEKKLMKKVPKDRWIRTHHQLVLFGRYHCKAIKPNCSNCLIKDICKYNSKNS